jgi:hypothetical protein
VPISNLRTLSLLKTGLPESEEVPVLVVEPLDNEDDWAIMDTLIVPLLRTLDPASSADQLDQVFLGLSPAGVKSFWRGAHTSAGLARLLGITRLQLYRSRKGKTDRTQTDEANNA